MDIRRLRTGEVVTGLAGVVLLAAMALMDWYGVEVPDGTTPISGFDAFRAYDVVDVLLVALALAAIALPILTAVRETPAIPVTTSVFLAIGAFVASLVVLFRIIDTPDLEGERFVLDQPGLNTGFETTLEPGLFAGFAATIAIGVGAWLAMRDDRA